MPERGVTEQRRGRPARSWYQALKWYMGLVGGLTFLALLNVLGEGLHGDGALRQWMLKVDTSVFCNVGHDVAVILVPPEALTWVGGGVRSLPVSREVEGVR